MKFKTHLFLAYFFLLSVLVAGQTTFEKTYGGVDAEVGYDVLVADDGGYTITGFTYSFGAGTNDCYLVKTDDQGILSWTQTFGGISAEFGISILQDANGDYLIAGTTRSYGAGSNDYYLIKTDNLGDTIWTKTYGGLLLDSPRNMIATSDNGYAIIGRTESFGNGISSVYFVKIDSAGNEEFSRTYGGSDLNWGVGIEQTSDGGYIIVGKTSSFNALGQDIYLIKTNSVGDTSWTKYFGTAADDWGNDVDQTSDGGYLISGTTEYSGTTGNAYVAKTDGNGNLLWSKSYGSFGDDFCNQQEILSTGDYLFIGATSSYGAGGYDLYLFKTDLNGYTIWTRTYGGTGLDAGYAAKETPDGGYILVGTTNSSGNGDRDVYLIKTDAMGTLTGVSSINVYDKTSQIVYPNPVVETAKFIIGDEFTEGEYSLMLFDASGKTWKSMRGQKSELIIERGTMPSGTYFYKISNKKGEAITGSIVFE